LALRPLITFDNFRQFKIGPENNFFFFENGILSKGSQGFIFGNQQFSKLSAKNGEIMTS